MKNQAPIYIIFSILFFSQYTNGQSPFINFQQCYGGTNIDNGYWASVQPDGSRYFGGLSSSNNADVSGNHGGADGWVLKTNDSGTILYQRSVGGSDFDFAIDGVSLSNGGLVCAGQTNSNDGDFANQNHGACDAFITELTPNGTIAWAKLWGGTQCDLFNAVWPVAAGGYVAAGETASSDGDVTNYHGGDADFWIVRTDANGNALWKKTYGGSGLDRAYDIWKTNDGNFIVTGETASSNGDFPVTQGTRDVVLMKISPDGNVLWAKTFGGNALDRGLVVRQKPNGDYIVLATTGSTSGQVSGFRGFRDFWLFRTDANGNLLQQRCLGGTGADDPACMELLPDGDILLGGVTNSNNGDVSDPNNQAQGWLLKLGSDFNIKWERLFGSVTGGANTRSINAISQTPDGDVLAMSSPESASGDVTCSKGGADFWVFTLSPSVGTVESAINPDWRIAPNPASEYIQIQGKDLEEKNVNVLIYNMLGYAVFEFNGSLSDVNTSLNQSVSQWPAGYYALQISTEDYVSTRVFVKN
jgi:hypothetical protein